MNTDRDFERTAQAWLAQGPDRLPDRVLDAVVDEIHVTPQRHALRVPWRTLRMNQMTRVLSVIAAVVVVVIGGVVLLRPGSPSSGSPSSGSPSGPGGSAGSSPGSSGLPPLSKTFTSTVNGFSISYPDGWKVVTATQSWPTGSTTFNPDDRSVDSFSGTNLAIYAVSQKLATSGSPTQWLDKYLSDAKLEFSNRPDCAVVKTEPIVVDGATGVMNYSCSIVLIDAIVTSGGRGYVFSMQGDSVDKAWVLDLLKTVKLNPQAAIDIPPSSAPSAAPSASQ